MSNVQSGHYCVITITITIYQLHYDNTDYNAQLYEKATVRKGPCLKEGIIRR